MPLPWPCPWRIPSFDGFIRVLKKVLLTPFLETYERQGGRIRLIFSCFNVECEEIKTAEIKLLFTKPMSETLQK